MFIKIPGWKNLKVDIAFFDINGTLTELGYLKPSTKKRLRELYQKFDIYLVSSDTRGKGQELAAELGYPLRVIDDNGDAAKAKLNVLHELGVERTIVFGNGANDALALEASALGICIMSEAEGAAKEAVMAADIIVKNIDAALDIILDPLRLVATLRR